MNESTVHALLIARGYDADEIEDKEWEMAEQSNQNDRDYELEISNETN